MNICAVANPVTQKKNTEQQQYQTNIRFAEKERKKQQKPLQERFIRVVAFCFRFFVYNIYKYKRNIETVINKQNISLTIRIFPFEEEDEENEQNKN